MSNIPGGSDRGVNGAHVTWDLRCRSLIRVQQKTVDLVIEDLYPSVAW